MLRFDLSILCVLSFFARSVYGKMPYEESLLVTQKLGVQIERVYFSGRRSYEFVDIDTIEDVIINEGITSSIISISTELRAPAKYTHVSITFELQAKIPRKAFCHRNTHKIDKSARRVFP